MKTIAELLNILKAQKQNNINAVKTRNTYSGENKVDVSQDILNITSKPLGQSVTYLRRPYYFGLEQINNDWTNIESNSVKGNSELPLIYDCGVYDCNLHLYNKDDELLYEIKTLTTGDNYKEAIIRWCGFENEFKLEFCKHGEVESVLDLKFSTGDFEPKSNCITEIVIEYSRINQGYTNTIKFYKILVRYMNP